MALIAAGFCTLSRFWLEIAIYSSTEIVLKGIYGVIILSPFVSHGHCVSPRGWEVEAHQRHIV